MTKDLKDLFGLDERKNHMVSEFIGAMLARHPYDRLHFIRHLEEKLEDGTKKACTEDMDQLCEMCIHVYGRDMAELIIEQIMPDEQEIALAAFLEGLNRILGSLQPKNGRKH